ncbi:NERD domain-containing protein [Ornithinibacillus sp. BX22]|uniref:NERD domain-containing protein n=2 Tax=Ornithinibacillus TaxID=484508 RepID=A0A923L915_9BACI|nr:MULTISPECIES: NERD domain-containing protein [Ornithinibacillus]MBC5638604.1 NERD domain-containing protein [Ornithinibacillus hominis]MBS3681973.1 NERD domain-containing protein [Ornithinibacillus massiliensis]
MAQLIKLQNYITRYEWDIYRYPSQFIRYKQDNWKKLLNLWNNPELLSTLSDIEEEQKKPSKWNLFQRKKVQDEVVEDTKHDVILPNTEEELKHYFLNQLIPFQFKWATSTISNVSFVAPKYYKDELLHYFLKRFPDTYLVMYYPVFEIRKAPVEGEIILISPLGIEIIYVLEPNQNTMITASDDRSWVLENGVKSMKQLSPIFALKRTEKIVKGILDKYDISFPIHKVVLSRTNIINFLKEPYHTRIIGKHEYDQWFQEKRSLNSPLKSVQLKAAEALLKHCQSSYVKRPEWVDEEEFDGGMMEEEG